jgi:hypothetical protein
MHRRTALPTLNYIFQHTRPKTFANIGSYSNVCIQWITNLRRKFFLKISSGVLTLPRPTNRYPFKSFLIWPDGSINSWRITPVSDSWIMNKWLIRLLAPTWPPFRLYSQCPNLYRRPSLTRKQAQKARFQTTREGWPLSLCCLTVGGGGGVRGREPVAQMI